MREIVAEVETEDYVGVLVHDLFDEHGRLVYFFESDVALCLDVKHDARGVADLGVLQGNAYGFADCGHDAVVAAAAAYAEVRPAHIAEHGAQIGEVYIQRLRIEYDVAYSEYALTEHAVGVRESVCHRRVIGQRNELLVGHDDVRVDDARQVLDTYLGVHNAVTAFEIERLCHDRDDELAELLCNRRDDGRRARAGALAHARRDDDEVGVLEIALDNLAALLRRLLSHVGIGARAQSLGQLLAYLYAYGSLGLMQILKVRIDRDKIDAGEPIVHHSVHGVSAAAAHADHGDL